MPAWSMNLKEEDKSNLEQKIVRVMSLQKYIASIIK